MGSLYHLGQKLVDFANIITGHANRNDTVPSSSLVYKGAQNIATIEDSNVASQAYSVGDFLILDGVLYRVTNAIASGGTITVGTNVTSDSVGSELKTLNDSLANIGTSLSSTTVLTSSLTAGQNTDICRITNVPQGTYIVHSTFRVADNECAGNAFLRENGTMKNVGGFEAYYGYGTHIDIHSFGENATVTFCIAVNKTTTLKNVTLRLFRIK